jgi:hypothetical protein
MYAIFLPDIAHYSPISSSSLITSTYSSSSCFCSGWSFDFKSNRHHHTTTIHGHSPTFMTRDEFWKDMTRETAAAVATTFVVTVATSSQRTWALDDNDTPTMTTTSTSTSTSTIPPTTTTSPTITNAELQSIVRKDVLEHQFLTNGQLTRSIYDESATFTDEIDTYTMDQWIVGTQRLFVADGSYVTLRRDNDNDDDIVVTNEQVEFQFEEDLMFNIPLFLWRPVVHLTGKVILKRSPDTGLITSYREYWDEDVGTVLRSAKFVRYS